jgi:hypothetical protein
MKNNYYITLYDESKLFHINAVLPIKPQMDRK